MKWTKEKPKKEGWYWIKTKSIWTAGGDFLYVIYATNTVCGDDNIPDSLLFHGQMYTVDEPEFLEFSGPIPLPEDT